MFILDVRTIRRPPRYINSVSEGQCIITTKEAAMPSVPVWYSNPMNGPSKNLLFANTAEILTKPGVDTLKIVVLIPANQYFGALIVERYYHVFKQSREAYLFRVSYRAANGNISHNRILTVGKTLQKMADPYSFTLLSWAQGLLGVISFHDLSLMASTWTRACEVSFSKEPVLYNLSYLQDKLAHVLYEAGGDERAIYEEIKAQLITSPNYKRLPLTDGDSIRQSMLTTVDYLDLVGLYQGPTIDPSPTPSLYPTETSYHYINRIDIFGKQLFKSLSYRCTDYSIRAVSDAGNPKVLEPFCIDYVVDRYGTNEPASSIWDVNQGINAADISDVINTYRQYKKCYGKIQVRITRTYEEEVVYEFANLETNEREYFYFDVNACVLISPDAVLNRFHYDSIYPSIGTNRDVSAWL